MVNYFVKSVGGAYHVIDGNTNRTIATFITEIDAQRFIQSFNNMNNPMGGGYYQQPYQPPIVQPIIMNQPPSYPYPVQGQQPYQPQQQYGLPMQNPNQTMDMTMTYSGNTMTPNNLFDDDSLNVNESAIQPNPGSSFGNAPKRISKNSLMGNNGDANRKK